MSSGQCWAPIPKNCCIATLQQDAQSAPQVGDSFSLLLPSVAGQCCTQFLHLPLCIWVPSPKSLCHNRQEGDPLSRAVCLCSIHFSLISVGESVASQVCCTWHGVVLDGGDDSDIQGGILAPCPVADQDICRSAIIARKEKSPLLDRAQTCSHSRVE